MIILCSPSPIKQIQVEDWLKLRDGWFVSQVFIFIGRDIFLTDLDSDPIFKPVATLGGGAG